MKYFKQILTCWLVAGGAGITGSYAQEGVHAAGGVATGAGGTASYSVGQVAYLEASGPGGTSSPGVGQPLELFVLSAGKPAVPELNCSASPNPATNTLELHLDEPALRGLRWRLTDLGGRTLLSQQMAGAHTTISIAALPAGAYLLLVESEAQARKTFKIIKH